MSLDKLFYPESVAVVGATRKRWKIGNIIIRNLSKFEGDVYAINPSYDEVEGFKCYPSILDAPDVDLVVIAIPAKSVLKVIEECGKKNIRNVVVISAGFKESGPDGAILEKNLEKLCRKYGINLVGPNSLGIMNTSNNLNATFSGVYPKRGKIAFLSQSGAFIPAVIDWANLEEIGFSKIVSLGNKTILNENDFLEYLRNDPETDIVCLYLEGISNGVRLVKNIRDMSKEKPVLVLKSGKTEAGAKAASSHTGSIAGSFIAFKTAMHQARAILVDSIKELFEISQVLLNVKEFDGNIAVVTNSGGAGVLLSDAIETHGLRLAKLSNNTINSLKNILPPQATFLNPIDMLGDADTERLLNTLKIVEQDPNVDVIIVSLTPTAQIDFKTAANAISTCKKPIIACFIGGQKIKEGIQILAQNNIPNFVDPNDAIKALSAVYKYSVSKKRVFRPPSRFNFDFDTIRTIIKSAQDAKILGVDGFKILKACNIKVAPYGFAKKFEDVKKIASKIGYPVVLKVVSPEIVHKSDIGCVKLNVHEDELEDAFYEIIRNAEKYTDKIVGVLVQKMIINGIEIIIGMKRDPNFGPLIMFGLGGIYVEVLKDVSFRIAPLDKNDAIEMIKEIRAYEILKGTRGRKGYNINAIVELLLKISQLSLDFPEILELDLNPIKVFEDEYYAIDFRCILKR